MTKTVPPPSPSPPPQWGVLPADSKQLDSLVSTFHAAIDSTHMFLARDEGDTCTATLDLGATSALADGIRDVQSKLVRCGVRVDRVQSELNVPHDAALKCFRFVAVTRHVKPLGSVTQPLVAAMKASLQSMALHMRAIDVQGVVDNTVSEEPVVKLGLLAVYIIGPVGTSIVESMPLRGDVADEDADVSAQPAGETVPVDAQLVHCKHGAMWRGTYGRHARLFRGILSDVEVARRPGSAFEQFADCLQRKTNRHTSRADGKTVVINGTVRVAMAVAMKYISCVTVPAVGENDVFVNGSVSNIIVIPRYAAKSTPTVTTVSLDDACCMGCVVGPVGHTLLQRDGGYIDGRVNWCLSGPKTPHPGFMVNIMLGGPDPAPGRV